MKAVVAAEIDGKGEYMATGRKGRCDAPLTQRP